MAKSFAAAALQDLASTIEEHDNLQAPPQVPEPSASEQHRIMRTLYILEAFFGVFDKTTMSKEEIRGTMHDFLLNFAHWEVEQMACVQEFLFAQVSRGYNEMAAHDVYWGRLQVPPALWYGDGGVQNLCFKGLVALEKLAAATTYDELYDRYGDGKTPASRSCHLYGTLEEFSRRRAIEGNDKETMVSEYQDVQDYSVKVRRPHFEDPDGGPFAIWKWANGSAPVSRSVYQAERWKLRKWGYALWDASRLQMLAACHDAWQPPSGDRFPWPPPPTYPPEDLDDCWGYSWEERAWIYHKGGRGWWAPGDESRIVWTKKENDGDRDGYGRKSKVPKTSHVVPTSLEEARKTILSLQRP